jgi:alkylation response protein AidB-like acyl-CoA dehydrogenase
MTIGLPPVLQFGPDWMKKKIGTEVLTGEKRIALAITEPFAGSDVAGVLTEAVKSADGTHYIVNGSKKWITGGHHADYFTTLCKTEGGMSMLLIPRTDGVETKAIKTAYSPSAGTSLITFENVKVPVENLVGIEGLGFMHAMYNFNHERWMIISYILAGMRGMVEECIKWANQRQAFGKKLIQQPVIRGKIGRMIMKVESTYAWFEGLTYQMNNLPYEQQSERLAGQCALLKVQATRSAWDIADDAIQCFGGRAITQTGMGSKVERFMRTNKFAAILGGSEEVMVDLGVKQLIKQIPATAKL